MKPEEKARQRIDKLLDAAGWSVQDMARLNLSASLGVAVREFPVESGFADYGLFVDRQAVGVIEAKSEGTTLSGVAEQSEAYITGFPARVPHVQLPLPFAYESTGFEGGAGETVRCKLLHECDVHTLLRLPTGVFYAQGVKANVLFFDRRPGSEKPWTDKLWIYDLRTNMHFTLKQNPMRYEDLQDFIACYNPENRHHRQETARFRAFAYDELMQRDKVSLDIFWLKDESLEDTENLPDPDVLAGQIVENPQAALEQFESIYEELGGE